MLLMFHKLFIEIYVSCYVTVTLLSDTDDNDLN